MAVDLGGMIRMSSLAKLLSLCLPGVMPATDNKAYMGAVDPQAPGPYPNKNDHNTVSS